MGKRTDRYRRALLELVVPARNGVMPTRKQLIAWCEYGLNVDAPEPVSAAVSAAPAPVADAKSLK